MQLAIPVFPYGRQTFPISVVLRFITGLLLATEFRKPAGKFGKVPMLAGSAGDTCTATLCHLLRGVIKILQHCIGDGLMKRVAESPRVLNRHLRTTPGVISTGTGRGRIATRMSNGYYLVSTNWDGVLRVRATAVSPEKVLFRLPYVFRPPELHTYLPQPACPTKSPVHSGNQPAAAV